MGQHTFDATVSLLAAYHAVLEAGTGVPLAPDEELLPRLALKSFGHCASAIQLVDRPTTFPTLPASFHDVGSVAVLCRAGFEALFTLHGLFLGSAPAAERRVRILSWKLRGALARRNLRPRTPEHRAVQAADAAAAAQLRQELALEDHYRALPKRERDQLDRGEWRHPESWPQIAAESGMSIHLAKESYDFLCGYAHSGALSAAQTGDLRDADQRRAFAVSLLAHLQVPLAKTSLAYAARFQGSRRMLEQRPDLADVLAIYSRIGDDNGQ